MNDEKKSGRTGLAVKVLTILLAVAVIIISLLGLFGFLPFEDMEPVILPMMGALCVVNGINALKTNRNTAIIEFVCAGLIFLCFAVILVIKAVR